MTDILAVYRAERFSPNSVDKDSAILEAVGNRLATFGHSIRYVHEEELTSCPTASVIISMARGVEALALLCQAEGRGTVVINSTAGIKSCARTVIDSIMRHNNLPAAPVEGNCGYWVKRGDEAAQSAADVRFAADKSERDAILADFAARGIAHTVVTAHVEGDLVKFYGVVGTGFFYVCYPGDDGCFKFKDELRNGRPRHYDFDREALHTSADRLAALTGVIVYGGDCIVRSDGSYAIIDFNDWPSFSRCCDNAARSIAAAVLELMKKG